MAKKKAAKAKSSKKPAKKAAAKKAAPKAKVAKKEVKAAPKKPIPVPPKKAVIVTPKNSSSKQYTQSEFIECVRSSCGFNSRSEAKEFYGNFASMIQQALKSGFRMTLPGLGKIQVKKRKARMGRNPATGEPMMIPAKKKVAFTPIKALKTAVL